MEVITHPRPSETNRQLSGKRKDGYPSKNNSGGGTTYDPVIPPIPAHAPTFGHPCSGRACRFSLRILLHSSPPSAQRPQPLQGNRWNTVPTFSSARPSCEVTLSIRHSVGTAQLLRPLLCRPSRPPRPTWLRSPAPPSFSVLPWPRFAPRHSPGFATGCGPVREPQGKEGRKSASRTQHRGQIEALAVQAHVAWGMGVSLGLHPPWASRVGNVHRRTRRQCPRHCRQELRPRRLRTPASRNLRRRRSHARGTVGDARMRRPKGKGGGGSGGGRGL